MAFKIELSDETVLDLGDARRFYSEISSEVLERFDRGSIKTIERIEENSQYFRK